MIEFNNLIYRGSFNRASVYDVNLPDAGKIIAVVVFIHGYKGFKDWGAWNLLSRKFTENGYAFVKFNLSHNGGTVENTIDFPDLQAFAENRYSFEVNDFKLLLNQIQTWFKEKDIIIPENSFYSIGHSRGGGIAILTASDPRVKKIVTWAAVSDFSKRFNFDIEKWQQEGVVYIKNSRTGQDLPHNYSFYKDFKDHERELDIPSKAKSLNKPWMIIHSLDDETVKPEEAEALAHFNKKARLYFCQSGGHTFGAYHPWHSEQLPPELKEICTRSIEFFKEA